MTTPRDDARQLAEKQRAGSDWFGHVSHDSPRTDSRCDTPRSGRGTGAFSQKYSGESDRWYKYDKSPTKEGAAGMPEVHGGGDADATVAPHERAFIDESTSAAPVEAAPELAPEPPAEPAPAAEPEQAPEPVAAEPMPKLDIPSSDSEPSSPEKRPSNGQTPTPKGEAIAHKTRGHNMSEDWYHYSEKQIGQKKSENGPVQDYNFDIKGLKTDTSSQASGYKNRNKGSASDWYKHGPGGAPAAEAPPQQEGGSSPSKKREQIDLSSKDKVREYAAQAKAGSAGSWFGHAGGEYTSRRTGKPRVTDEGQSFADRDKGSFSIFSQQSPAAAANEPVRTTRGMAPRGGDSMSGLMRMDGK